MDCHQHLCHYEWVRLVPDLLKWLEAIYEVEAKFADLNHARKVSRLFFHELARNGTTACCVHGPYFPEATDVAFAIAKESGLRILMGMTAGDTGLPDSLLRDPTTLIEDATALCRKWDGKNRGLLSWCFTVRPAYCASESLLRQVAAAAMEQGARIQSHLGENLAGQRQILERFPGCGSEVNLYDETGILTPRTIMAHAIHLSENDFHRLACRRVAVAHCPRANLLSGGAQFSLRTAWMAKLHVGLGTDLGAGKGLSVFRSMEDAIKVTSGLSVHDVFRMGTLGSAAALGLEAEIGSLEAGKSADFVIVRPPCTRPSDCVRLLEIDGLLASLVFHGDDRCIESVCVRGREVFSTHCAEEGLSHDA
ncbi:MAG: amidohydrolase family protein [Planctomycetaceae bacterium]|nr:amidohydrolase family protein [Planctomycetaceae bacterium]